MNFNTIVQAGRLTRDPEERTIPDGTFLCEFTVASNRKIGDREETLFMDWTAWGKTAEAIVKWFSIGKPILVTGRMRTEQWEKDGVRKSKIRATVSEFAFVTSKNDDENEKVKAPTASSAPAENGAPDVIPF